MDHLEFLHEYLLSDDAHPDSLGLSDFDGFLTGIACCPEPIPVEEWLDFALGVMAAVPDNVMGVVTAQNYAVQALCSSTLILCGARLGDLAASGASALESELERVSLRRCNNQSICLNLVPARLGRPLTVQQ